MGGGILDAMSHQNPEHLFRVTLSEGGPGSDKAHEAHVLAMGPVEALARFTRHHQVREGQEVRIQQLGLLR